MQRPPNGTFTISIYPLLGAVGLLAMSGCAAVPAMSLASGLFKPAQTVQAPPAGTPAPNMLSSLAQQFGITLPSAPTAAPTGAPNGMLPGTLPALADASPTPVAK